MDFRNELADDAVLEELGRRIGRLRLDRNLTQQQLADEAGVSRHTMLRLEGGESVTLGAWLRVLRALDLLDRLGAVVPEPLPSPLEQLEREGARRRRASGSRAGGAGGAGEPWRWGTP